VSRIRGWRRIFRWDGTFSRQDLSFEKEQNIYICPTGEILTTTGKLVNHGDALLYKTRDCRSCLLKAQCCPKKPLRRIPRKCKARLGDWRGSDDELREPAEVLRGCRQGELELGTAWSAQAQTTQPEDPLEMCKQDLNSFAIAARAIEYFGLKIAQSIYGIRLNSLPEKIRIIRAQIFSTLVL
jgi:hypothetical protein